MTPQVTIEQLVQYILKNRRGNAFKDYSQHLIENGIKIAYNQGTMLCAVNNDGEVCGIVIARAYHEQRIMDILDILTTEKWVLPKFVREFLARFPEYELTGLRDGIRVDYKTKALCNKIMKGNI
jgi:hypothetical protein